MTLREEREQEEERERRKGGEGGEGQAGRENGGIRKKRRWQGWLGQCGLWGWEEMEGPMSLQACRNRRRSDKGAATFLPYSNQVTGTSRYDRQL